MILAETFPREIAFPERRQVINEEQFKKMVEAYNGKKNIYYSIYDNTQTIDKVFFDFDGADALADARKLVEWCLRTGYRFTCFFSGKKGFHVYVFCNKTKEKKLLKNAHLAICKELSIKNDIHVNGDIARVARVPNTYHITGKAYCIGLTKEEILTFSFEKIREIAQKPNSVHIYGKRLLELTALPTVINYYDDTPVMDIELKETNGNHDDLLANAPPCVSAWLKLYEYAIHRNRFYFAVACRDLGLSPEETAGLAKKYYSEMKESSGVRTRYQEFRSERVLEYAFGKSFIIPTCDTLMNCGSCPMKCSKYTAGGFPLYKILSPATPNLAGRQVVLQDRDVTSPSHLPLEASFIVIDSDGE